MTLDEAIKHCEEVAEENEKISLYTPVEFIPADLSIEQCQNCAAEHRQLAEWLKDYKRMKEQKPILDKIKAEIETKYGQCDICEYFEDYDYEENDISEYRPIGDITDILQIIDKYKADNSEIPNNSQEPKTGHWIATYGNVKCSVCGSVKDSREVGKATHYCDFCGAKMESQVLL